MAACRTCKYKSPCDNLSRYDLIHSCSDFRNYIDEVKEETMEEFIQKIKINEYLFKDNVNNYELFVSGLEQVKEEMRI